MASTPLIILCIACMFGKGYLQTVNALCKSDLARYRITFYAEWSNEDFPKQYPLYRPPAQWSKLVGRSHNAQYNLWSIGQLSSPGVKEMAETGKSEILDEETQGAAGLFDEFITPAISSGVGTSSSDFFLDNSHSKVSVMSHIVPSPDWFVGIDSLDLCVGGKWVEEMVVDLDPLDAGTDNGYTFTAPNWASNPQEKMYQITAQYPNHPANSFFYPQHNKLPRIGYIQFVKLREYSLGEIFVKHVIPEMENEKLSDSQDNAESEPIDDDASALLKLETTSRVITTTTTTTTSAPTTPTTTVTTRKTHEPTSKSAISDEEARKKLQLVKALQTAYTNEKASTHHKKKKKGRGNKKKGKYGDRRDCIVSEWSDWSSCSKTCGFGEKIRTRSVIQQAQNGGSPCPTLEEKHWCGTMRNCGWQHFTWAD